MKKCISKPNPKEHNNYFTHSAPGTWYLRSQSGQVPVARYSHSAVVVPAVGSVGEEMLVYGGFDKVSGQCNQALEYRVQMC